MLLHGVSTPLAANGGKHLGARVLGPHPPGALLRVGLNPHRFAFEVDVRRARLHVRSAPKRVFELRGKGIGLIGRRHGLVPGERGTEPALIVARGRLQGLRLSLGVCAPFHPVRQVADQELDPHVGRRRHIALRPALRSLASRLGVWLWVGVLLAFFTFAGLLPNGDPRPLAPDSEAAQDWPILALAVLGGLSALGWLVARPRLVPTRAVTRTEELGGHLAAMLGLGVVALVVAAQNPFALIFVLPSLHAWLWLPHASERGRPVALLVYAAGLLGPLLLLASFAFRFEMGLDALWYLVALVSVGYVSVPLLIAFLALAPVPHDPQTRAFVLALAGVLAGAPAAYRGWLLGRRYSVPTPWAIASALTILVVLASVLSGLAL